MDILIFNCMNLIFDFCVHEFEFWFLILWFWFLIFSYMKLIFNFGLQVSFDFILHEVTFDLDGI